MHTDPLDQTHVPLPGGQWAIWRPVLLRAPGFPAAGVTRLAAPELAALADEVTRPSAGQADWAGYRDAFDAGMLRLTARLRDIVTQPRFRLAMTWQNHNSVETGLGSFLRRRPEIDGRNKRYRQHEELLVRYWQRYCVKNDTIGFFGPIGWGRLDPDRATTEVRTGSGLTAGTEVFFETWAVDRLAATIGGLDGVREWLAPRIPPFVRIADGAARMPGVRPIPLSEQDIAVLHRCDGRTPARRIADAAGDDAYAILDRLARKRIVWWRLDVPVSLRPELDLRRLVAGIGDPELATRGLAMLDRLETAREDVRQVADDPVELAKTLATLDSTFGDVTGAAPNRNAGKAYGGRTLVYHDALRAATPTLGRDFLDRLRPLELLLRASRWLTHRIGERLIATLTDLFDEHVAEHGEPPSLAWLWIQSMPLIHDAQGSVAEAAAAELRRRWADVLACPAGATRVRYTSAELADRVAEVFDAPAPGWPAARYCSPDVMITARDADALRRGDYDLVLGEFHVAINTLRSAAAIGAAPRPADLFDCVTAESTGPRLYPVLAKDSSGRLSARTHPGLVRDRDYLVALFDQTVDPSHPHLLRAVDLTVEQAGGRLWVTEPDGHRFDVLDALAEMLMNLVVDTFGVFPEQRHTPRLTIDRLVVTRESWTFPADELTFAGEKAEADRFARARRWVRDNGLPRRVFAKVAQAEKPIYVDFDSPFTVGMLAKAVRSSGEAGRIHLTEVLPDLENLWLTDENGESYTSELRLAVVDLGGA
ncbi:MAG TPA: lantibiotic dehydratase [Pseudonocardiaceae bacterium]|nr:lantibiotic dehydratase [Pseudonocardiaceae bacterium]